MSHKSRKSHAEHVAKRPVEEPAEYEHHGKHRAAEPDLPDVPGSHDQPWVPKSGLVGRKRRSPRQ
ncbi:MAG TPA: hypothetical protein VLW53_20405 [Candidatus Eisenbacteria bacterium]|nr:hypothetical protein [Candidatus Eisenbacteria bacterium]